MEQHTEPDGMKDGMKDGWEAGSDSSGHQEHNESFDPWTEIQELHRRLDVLAAHVSSAPTRPLEERPPIEREPEMDIYENEREFLIYAALPGIAPDRIHIEATLHTITLSAETSYERRHSDRAEGNVGAKRHRRSRYMEHERFRFVYVLPGLIELEHIRATLRHGVVELRLPKMMAAPKAVTVPVLLHEASGHSPVVTQNAASETLVVIAHEGNPARKLGAAYVPSAGEDHTSKAKSTGEYPHPEPTRIGR